MGLESLKPEMPNLEEHGIYLYQCMIESERAAILNIKNSTSWFFNERCTISKKKPIKLVDHINDGEKSTRGKILVITNTNFDYQSLIDDIYHARREFFNYLQIQKDRLSMANKIEPFSVINIEPLFQRNCYLLSLDFSR